jgi:hypothetical protein
VRLLRPILLPAIFLLALIVGLNGCKAMAGTGLRVLFIGNSHLQGNNVPSLLAQLARTETRSPNFDSILRGGFTLENHWNAGDALSAIRRGGWDYVVLQPQSLEPLEKTASYFRYVRLFNAEIQRVGARTVLHLSWARKDIGNPVALQPRWTAPTLEIARELGAGVVPVGPVWSKSQSDFPELVLHASDGNHATLAGSYLTACAYYVAFYRKSPLGKSVPFGLEAVRTALQSSAWEGFNAFDSRFWP